MRINNKENKIEKLMLNYLLIMGLIGRYIEYSFLWNFGFLMLFLLIFLLSSDFRHSFFSGRKILLFMMLFFLLFMNATLNDFGDYFFSNLFQIIKVVLLGTTIVSIASEDNLVFEEFINKKIVLLNVFWILNIISLFLQEMGTGFLIKQSWIESNPYLIDHWCGLFGNSGTHVLAIFSIFIFWVDLYYLRLPVCKNRRLIRAYLFITTSLMFLLSITNDNKSLFILFFIFLIYYILCKIFVKKNNIVIKFVKILSYTLLIFIVLSLLIKIPAVNNLYYNLSKTINSLISFNSNAYGSSERLLIFVNSLQNGFGWGFGKGFGAWSLDSPNYLGFTHFGISSIGTIVTLCGIWFYSILVLFWASVFSSIRISKNRKLIINLLNIIILVVMSIYTTIFTDSYLIIWCSLLFCVLIKRIERVD